MDFEFINPVYEAPLFGHYAPGEQQLQGGAGLGQLFAKVVPFLKSAVKSIFPALRKAATHETVKKIGREVRDRAVEAGLDIAASAVKGENVGQAAKKNLDLAKEDLAKSMVALAEQRRAARKNDRGTKRRKKKGEETGDEEEEESAGGSGKKKKKKTKPAASKKKEKKKKQKGLLFALKGR